MAKGCLKTGAALTSGRAGPNPAVDVRAALIGPARHGSPEEETVYFRYGQQSR